MTTRQTVCVRVPQGTGRNASDMVRYVFRSLLHYWRPHIVVMLAVAVSTAVIGGALIVGDSVRASLRQMTLGRLGGISHVLHTPRFVREQLAADIAASALTIQDLPEDVVIAPAILTVGSVERTDADRLLRRAAGTTIAGVHPQHWELFDTGGVQAPTENGIVLGHRTAQDLQAAIGDSLSVWVELPSSVPRDSLLGEREETTVELVLSVEGVLSEHAGASRFSLQAAQQLPHNAFVSLMTIQQRLRLDERVPGRRNPTAHPARVNSLLIGRKEHPARATVSDSSRMQSLITADLQGAERLQQHLRKSLTVEDPGLRFRTINEQGYVSVESDSMILEDPLSDAVRKAASAIGMRAVPTLVYLANEINAAARTSTNSRYSMYSIIAGLDFSTPDPLGPFRLSDGTPVPELGDDDILLSHWLAEDLQVSVGDIVQARWHDVGSHGDLPETHHAFTVRGIFAADDPVSIDRDLTPFVDGVTNVESFGDWDQPFEMEMNRITERDDEYWEQYRATPKAFVSIRTAERFWSSRFGHYTSIRVAADGTRLTPDRLTLLSERLQTEIRPLLDPQRLGLMIRPLRVEGLLASEGANDFTQLFVGFSFFLILSAILLAALMFQLSVRQRVNQIGLMEAVGFTPSRARRFFVIEGLTVAAIGLLPGGLLAVGFAKLMIHGLTTWWVGATGTRFLLLDVRPEKVAIAAGICFALSGVVIQETVRRTSRRTVRDLLNGMTSDEQSDIGPSLTNRLLSYLFPVSVAVAAGMPIAVLTEMLPSGEAFQGLTWKVIGFFLAGFGWLVSGLLLLRTSLMRRAGDAVTSSQVATLSGLALANAARNPQRSLMTTALIAFAAFVIVAAAAGRRDPTSEDPDLKSGNGGFSLVAESSLPILFDLNTAEGRTRLGLSAVAGRALPEGTRVFGFRVKPGQDASCLNLFQTTVPTLLGATPEFIQRGGFRFTGTPMTGDDGNAWLRLKDRLPDSTLSSGAPIAVPTIPVIGDMNTLQYSLKKGLNDVIYYPDEKTPQYALKIAGMLDGSVFQGVLVMSDENLRRLAPEVSGNRYFLVETAPSVNMDDVAATLETVLREYGVDTERVSRRLADFLAVQNTYLSTFQMLGGLGLLVGTFGLATVMLRNVLERRTEIGLLRALGFLSSRLVALIAIENTLLLGWGIVTGTVAAAVAMLPHLLSTGADVPWLYLSGTLIIVVAFGTIAVIFPVLATLRVSVRDVLSGD